MIVWLLLGCAAHDPRPVADLFPQDTVIIGHRGAAKLAPENTMAGFEVADQLGVGFEFDVHLTADGVPVVVHDADLARTTSGHGEVSETPLEVVQSLEAGMLPDGTVERVPTLAQVYAAYGGHHILDVELKAPPNAEGRQALAQAFVDATVEAGLTGQVVVTSFDPLLLAEVRAIDPTIRRGQLTSRFKKAGLNPIVRMVLRGQWLRGKADPDFIAVEDARLRRGNIRRWQRKGYEVFAWTVNGPERMDELMAWGVDGIITDRPDIALRRVSEAP